MLLLKRFCPPRHISTPRGLSRHRPGASTDPDPTDCGSSLLRVYVEHTVNCGGEHRHLPNGVGALFTTHETLRGGFFHLGLLAKRRIGRVNTRGEAEAVV